MPLDGKADVSYDVHSTGEEGIDMGKTNIPRVIISIFTSNTVLFALSTSPINEALAGPMVGASETPNPATALQRQDTSERVVVKSRGRNLDFTLVGPPGRLCAIGYHTADMKPDDWKAVPNTRALIGGTGIIVISLDMTSFMDKEVSFIVMTSFTEPFNPSAPGLRGTAPFVVHMSSKQVSAIPQMQRPTQTGAAAAVASRAFGNLSPVRNSLLLQQQASERVVIKSRGKNLEFTVAGAPGRICSLVYRTPDMKRDSWRLVPNTKAVIGESGLVVFSLDMASFMDKEVSLSLLTSFTEPINTSILDLRGTAPFVIHMSSKQVSAIPEMQRLTVRDCATLASACGRQR